MGFIVGRLAERLEAQPRPEDLISKIDQEKAIHDELTFYGKLTEETELACL
jgi:hypothetical protein